MRASSEAASREVRPGPLLKLSGEEAGYLLTQQELAASAADRARMRLQAVSDSDIQGGTMSGYARRMRALMGLNW